MLQTACPVCDAQLRLGKTEVMLGKRLTCPECGAVLEVVEEDPLELQEVFDFPDELEVEF